jgi:hypothetical protein
VVDFDHFQILKTFFRWSQIVTTYIFSPLPKTFFAIPKILRTFALASLTCISAGGQLHIERRYLRFVFVYLNVGTSNIVKQKPMQKGRHGLCKYSPGVC